MCFQVTKRVRVRVRVRARACRALYARGIEVVAEGFHDKRVDVRVLAVVPDAEVQEAER